jgi:hypothetical protein
MIKLYTAMVSINSLMSLSLSSLEVLSSVFVLRAVARESPVAYPESQAQQQLEAKTDSDQS